MFKDTNEGTHLSPKQGFEPTFFKGTLRNKDTNEDTQRYIKNSNHYISIHTEHSSIRAGRTIPPHYLSPIYVILIVLKPRYYFELMVHFYSTKSKR